MCNCLLKMVELMHYHTYLYILSCYVYSRIYILLCYFVKICLHVECNYRLVKRIIGTTVRKDLTEFSSRMKEARKVVGLRQVDVAEKMGITPSDISRYETKTVVPSQDRLIALATLYGVSVNYLLEPLDLHLDKDTEEIAPLFSKDTSTKSSATKKTRYCPFCGDRAEENWQFCTYCGKQLPVDKPSATKAKKNKRSK